MDFQEPPRVKYLDKRAIPLGGWQMKFNSYVFLFAFLPVVLSGYFLLGRTRYSRLANIWLTAASLFFYGYWDWHYLPLLLGSILVNYLISGVILRLKRKGQLSWERVVFWVGIFLNIGLLAYYKYLDFLLDAVNDIAGTSLPLLHLILPLGISFFTITQILALIDCHEDVVKSHNFWDYALFVSFFPHLMAGPILYHKPMMRQFQDEHLRRLNWENLSMGCALFILGLVKKVLIADNFTAAVAWGYGQAADISFFAAWFTVICYALELYFDFSGYSDMAVGLARMMNIKIPINFNKPFYATSVANFWQRWHISLTNAITACVYVPLVRVLTGGRGIMPGFPQSLCAATIAFFVVGIWHGAGWTFVLFALLQSGGIAVGMLWKKYGKPLPELLAHLLMLIFIALSFAVFRAPDFFHAKAMCGGLIGRHGFDIPQTLLSLLGPMGGIVPLPTLVLPADAPLLTLVIAILLAALGRDANDIVRRIAVSPKPYWAAVLALGFLCCVLQLSRGSVFLYFQF